VSHKMHRLFCRSMDSERRSQWPLGLRRRSTAARSPATIVGSNPIGGMDVCLLCVLSGRGLCNEMITRPAESYRLWRVVVCYHENLENEKAIARIGMQSQKKMDSERLKGLCN
jgi:hypothetical protein